MTDKVSPIQLFARECAQFPAQYTPEWFARIDSVGGSDMNELMRGHLRLAATKVIKTMTRTHADATYVPPSTRPAAQPADASTKAIHTMGGTMVLGDDDDVVIPPSTLRVQLPPCIPVCTMSGTDVLDDDSPLVTPAPQEAPQTPEAPQAYLRDSTDISRAPGVVMGFGTLFEPVSCNYIARRMGARVECRSVSYFRGPFRFSPDGLFVDAVGAYASLEMKNPHSYCWGAWDPAHNDQFQMPHLLEPHPEEIKPEYIPQLQTGMHLIPFLSYAFFVETVYRRANAHGSPCAIGTQQMAKVRDAPILDRGVIGFYHPSGTGNVKTAYDFSSRDNDSVLCHVISHQRDDVPFVPLYFVQPDGAEPEADASIETGLNRAFKSAAELPAQHEGKPLFGFMPYVLLGIHAVRVERNPHFISGDLQHKAEFVAAFVGKCKGLPNDKKIEALRELCDTATTAGNKQAVDIARMIDQIKVDARI